MKTTSVLSALLASSLASAYTVVIADSEYTQLTGLPIVAKKGGFSVSKSGKPANFVGGDGTLSVRDHDVFVDAKGRVGYGKVPKGATTVGWSKDSKELHWTKGAIFACPNDSFNIGTPTSYELYANWESTVTGQADDCFSVHLAVKSS